MSRNIRSVILFFTLLSIVLFLAGFRYGKFVERADKSYVPPAPTLSLITLSPTQKPFAVISYLSKACGVSFLYPNYLEEENSSSQEAKLSNNADAVHLTCDKTKIELAKQERKTASPSAMMTVLNKRVPLYEHNNLSSIIVLNVKTGQSILLEVTNNLTKLVFPSLELTK